MNLTGKEISARRGKFESPRIYKKIVGKSGAIWLVPQGKFAATDIHVWQGDNDSGYGGATLSFELEDGLKLNLKGPWHCNAEALYQDTGIDIRDKYATFVVIGLDREYQGNSIIPNIQNVIHIDQEFQEDTFERGVNLAKAFAQELKRRVFYYVETAGGAHSGYMEFKAPSEQEKDTA